MTTISGPAGPAGGWSVPAVTPQAQDLTVVRYGRTGADRVRAKAAWLQLRTTCTRRRGRRRQARRTRRDAHRPNENEERKNQEERERPPKKRAAHRQPDIDVLLRCKRNCQQTCQFANSSRSTMMIQYHYTIIDHRSNRSAGWLPNSGLTDWADVWPSSAVDSHAQPRRFGAPARSAVRRLHRITAGPFQAQALAASRPHLRHVARELGFGGHPRT